MTGDRGGATVWVLAAGLSTLLVGSVSAGAGAAMVTRHRAEAAADLGALAAASRVIEGEESACGFARVIVDGNGGRLVSCRVDGFDVVVTVQARGRGVLAAMGAARATARAGPT